MNAAEVDDSCGRTVATNIEDAELSVGLTHQTFLSVH